MVDEQGAPGEDPWGALLPYRGETVEYHRKARERESPESPKVGQIQSFPESAPFSKERGEWGMISKGYVKPF